MKINVKSVLIGIIVLAVGVRVIAAIYLGDQVVDLPGTADQISYHNLALRLIGGYGFTFGKDWWPATPAGAPTAHWSYLYTFYLAFVYIIFGPHPLAARVIQALVAGIFHPYFVFLIARRVSNFMIGLIAAALTGLYTYFIYYAASLMTESFYMIAILASLYLGILIAAREPVGQKKNVDLRFAILLGLCLGIAVLLRQLYLLFIPFLFIWILLAGRKLQGRKLFPLLTLSGVIVIIMIIPFTIFNYARFNRFVLLNTNSGFAFFWANHPIYGTHFIPILPPSMGNYASLIPPELLHLDEAALDQALLSRGIHFVIENPIRYILLSISRIPAYFMFWPSSDSGLISNISRVAGFGLFLPFMLYGIILNLRSESILNLWRKPSFLLLLFAFIYTAIHLLSWSLVRYRLPVDAVFLIFAAAAIEDLVKRLRVLQLKPVGGI